MKALSDADRYADVKLDLSCPKCGSGGLIPLKQLNRVLYCYGCRSRFGVERQGLVERPQDRIQVHVRTHSSDWKGHEAIIQNRSAVFRNWLWERGSDFFSRGWGRWALATTLVLMISGSIALGRRGGAEKRPLDVPDSLEGRAKMFTEAVARRNMEVMIRLTNPAQHRALRIWLAHDSALPQPVEDPEVDLNAKILQSTPSPQGNRANLRVQISPAAGKLLALNEQWTQQRSVWYFEPVRWRSPTPARGTVQPYSKRTRR
jgi:hypothetical protein